MFKITTIKNRSLIFIQGDFASPLVLFSPVFFQTVACNFTRRHMNTYVLLSARYLLSYFFFNSLGGMPLPFKMTVAHGLEAFVDLDLRCSL